MQVKKKTVSRALIILEVIIFLVFYCWGSDGVSQLNDLKKENKQLTNAIELIQKEVASLEDELVRFQKDPFFKEKIAREQLQMAYKNEEILFIKEGV